MVGENEKQPGVREGALNLRPEAGADLRARGWGLGM